MFQLRLPLGALSVISLLCLTLSPELRSQTFTPGPAGPSHDYAITASTPGDFNGDGKTDFVATDGLYNIYVYLSTDVGYQQAAGSPFNFASSPGGQDFKTAIASGDFNGDGKQDLAIVTRGSSLYLLLGDGMGRFSLATGSPILVQTYGSISQLFVRDFNNDGILDVLAGAANGEVSAVLLGDGAGGFSIAAGSPFVATSTSSMAVADFNNDGIPDIAGFNDRNTIGILLGNGLGGFTAGPTAVVGPADILQTLNVSTVADLDGDGTIDLVIHGLSLYVLFGDGTGAFPTRTVVNLPRLAGEAAGAGVAADFNGDGKVDIGLLVGQSLYIFSGDGFGGFSPAPGAGPFSGSLAPSGVSVVDFNGDGKPDVSDNFGNILLNNSPGNLPAVVTLPANQTFVPSSITFRWTAGFGVSEYFLYIGNSPSLSDIYGKSQGMKTSVTVTGLPSDGRNLYVRLFSRIGGIWNYNDYVYNTGTGASIASPVNGSAIAGSTLFQWVPGSVTASEYFLYEGTVRGASDLYGQSQGLGTSAILYSPVDLRTIYVRLFTRIVDHWFYKDYSYTAGGIASITSPANGAGLGSSATFQWAGGAGASEYLIYIGTAPGRYDYYYQSQGLSTAVTINSLPSGKQPYYLRLYTRLGPNWYFRDYTYYPSAGPLAIPAVLSSPAAGSVLPGSSVTFQWSPAAGFPIEYLLDVNGVFSGSTGLATSKTITGIPTDGRFFGVTLTTRFNGASYSNAYRFLAAGGTAGAMNDPVDHSIFNSSVQRFNWKASPASEFFLYIGNQPGLGDIYAQSTVDQTPIYYLSNLTVPGLPTDGRPLYVRLFTRFGATWVYNDYTYAAAGAALAQMSLPTNGSSIHGTSQTFQWTAGAHVNQYFLYVGSGPGAADYFSSEGASTSVTASGLPANGSIIYVRLFSYLGGFWAYNDYQYLSLP